MPDILVEVVGSWLDGRQTAFLKAVHGAIVQALKTPEDEPLARLVEHPPTHYLTPHSTGERFTRIEIALLSGRSPKAKRGLYQELTRSLRPFDVPPEDVKVVLVETPHDNVSLGGGKAVSDIDLGYSLQV